MRAGIHFHGKLKSVFIHPDKPSESVVLVIKIDQRIIGMLNNLKLFGYHENTEIEVTIAND